MKKVFVFFLLAFVSLILAIPVFAQTLENGEVVTLPKDKTVDSDYFAWGERVTISGTVNGDTYVGGGNVLVDGTINGDLLVGGGSVTIRGNILKDLRAAGGQVSVAGKVEGNVTAAGGNVDIQDSAQISGSVTGAGGDIKIFSPIGRGATLAGGNVTIGNSINGDILAGVGNLALTSNAQAQNVTYYSSKKADIQEGAQIKGQISQKLPPKAKEKQETAKKILTGARLIFAILSLVSSLIIGYIFTKFLPNFTNSAALRIRKNPFGMFLAGFLALVLIPILSVLLLITVVGIPIGLIALVGYTISLYLSKLFVAVAVGQVILSRDKRSQDLFLALAGGLIAYLVLTLIPVIGPIVTFLTLTVGLGTILFTKKEFIQNFRDKKLL